MNSMIIKTKFLNGNLCKSINTISQFMKYQFILFSLFLIMFVFSLGDSDYARAYVEGHYTDAELCWKGAFHNGDSTISISGCGAEVFYCSDKSSCSINAQKDEDNSHELCVRINDKSACTTAGYGVAQVDY